MSPTGQLWHLLGLSAHGFLNTRATPPPQLHAPPLRGEAEPSPQRNKLHLAMPREDVPGLPTSCARDQERDQETTHLARVSSLECEEAETPGLAGPQMPSSGRSRSHAGDTQPTHRPVPGAQHMGAEDTQDGAPLTSPLTTPRRAPRDDFLAAGLPVNHLRALSSDLPGGRIVHSHL